ITCRFSSRHPYSRSTAVYWKEKVGGDTVRIFTYLQPCIGRNTERLRGCTRKPRRLCREGRFHFHDQYLESGFIIFQLTHGFGHNAVKTVIRLTMEIIEQQRLLLHESLMDPKTFSTDLHEVLASIKDGGAQLRQHNDEVRRILGEEIGRMMKSLEDRVMTIGKKLHQNQISDLYPKVTSAKTDSELLPDDPCSHPEQVLADCESPDSPCEVRACIRIIPMKRIRLHINV
ncbi:hypothetical protein TELCIR_10593, partial [Teladorsagia circumcincta]